MTESVFLAFVFYLCAQPAFIRVPFYFQGRGSALEAAEATPKGRFVLPGDYLHDRADLRLVGR